MAHPCDSQQNHQEEDDRRHAYHIDPNQSVLRRRIGLLDHLWQGSVADLHQCIVLDEPFCRIDEQMNAQFGIRIRIPCYFIHKQELAIRDDEKPRIIGFLDKGAFDSPIGEFAFELRRERCLQCDGDDVRTFDFVVSWSPERRDVDIAARWACDGVAVRLSQYVELCRRGDLRFVDVDRARKRQDESRQILRHRVRFIKRRNDGERGQRYIDGVVFGKLRSSQIVGAIEQ